MAKIAQQRRERLAAIAEYLSVFSDPAAPVGEWFQPKAKPGSFSEGSFVLNADAERFVDHCYTHDWVLRGFRWGAWAQTEEAQALRDEPSALAAATEHQLAQLLTVVIRQSRFVEGALAGAFESGLILGILQRTEQLAKQIA